MQLPTIGELVKGGKTAKLMYVTNGTPWYQIDDFLFPIDEVQGACFQRNEKAITLMRWVRKHLDFLQKSMDDAGVGNASTPEV